MKLLRNPEAARVFWLYAGLTAAAFFAARLMDERFGWLMLGVCAMFTVIWYISTTRRYRQLNHLALQIDRILHGDDSIFMDNCAEGELAIVASEIGKMTVRLREQQQRLVEDKVYLADSIADISHQIRTPLTAINLVVQFLSEPDITEQRRTELCRELYSLLSRIEWLITALLKISKLDAGTVQFKKESMDYDALLHRACTPLLVPMELRAQELVIRGEGIFRGDIAWTCEALGNIIKNCMEHTPEGGTVTVTAAENALYSEINIEDNGGGIAKEDLPNIFERFYKGKNSGEQSFGIGLALSRMIITGQNGTIKAANSPNGARFTIRFFKETV